MEKTSQSSSTEQTNAAVLALEERIRALEQLIGEQRSGTAAPGAAEGERSIHQGELAAELERYRDQLRDYEKALVERIADVDDDRRATTSRLQRAWQTQREQIDDRLRRHSGLVAGVLLLFAVCVAAALFLVYRQAGTEQPQLAAEVADLRQELARIGDGGSSDRLAVELSRLGKDVEEIASSLERREGGERRTDRMVSSERALREEADGRVAKEMSRLEGELASVSQEQANIKTQLEALRAALAVVQGGRDAAPAAAPGTKGGAQTERPQGDGPTDDASSGAEGETEDLVTATREAAPSTGGASDEVEADAPGSEGTLVAGEGSYALQLIGFFNRDSLAEFAARGGLPGRVYYLRQTYKGRPWYALVHSLHQGYAAAAEALNRLPPDLVALGPWIRPVAAGTELRVLETGSGQ
jgi:DamX protein